jgi:DNA polymerase-3 subunit alpha
MSALALTEHGNVASHVKLEIAASKTGVKPIYGCELYTGYIDEERRTQQKNHLTVLARDADGYRNLLRLVSRAGSDGFYYYPTADGQMLEEHKSGLVVLSGCQGSLLFTSLMGGKGIDPADASYRRAKRVARQFKASLGDAYYIEVQAFPELDDTRTANPLLARIARELRIPLVATMDVHYTTVREREMQQVLHNVRGGGRKTLEEQAREWGYKAALAPPASDRAIYRRLRKTGLSHDDSVRAILNTESIAEGCNVELPRLPTIRFPTDHPRGAMGEWEHRIREGWRSRGFDALTGRARRDAVRQLRKERRIVEQKDFIDYFLVVADVVVWAKNNGIGVGPARGSAAASLICYLLRITEVNPMEYPNLVFERFIDVTREDLPDIDLDFDSHKRGEIRDYLVGRYGRDCVNNIGTFSTYKSKLALDDVARVHSIPKYEVEKVKALLIERSSGDLRASATIEDTFDYFDDARAVLEEYPRLRDAVELEGNIKGFGIHAAGIVVSNGPITDVASVVERTVDGELRTVVAMDKYDAERQGLLKLDLLGLSTVSMLVEACRQVEMPFADLYGMRLDDERVIDGFRKNDVTGIFQFEGRATRSINGALKPDSFQEIADISALSRPGPLHNGASAEYIAIKTGKKIPEVRHEIIRDITEFTKYQVIYQEQILRIVREVGKFSWTHAAYIRKIISRKLGDAEFNRQWETFLTGALENGLSEDEAKDIWGLCITAGSYAFNYAHCVAYGMLGYWCMWFKVYHPEAFYVAALRELPKGHAGGGYAGQRTFVQDKHLGLMKDAANRGIEIAPPDLVRSGVTWERGVPGQIVGGFSQVPGIGEKTASAIIESREQAPFSSWADLTRVKGIGPKTAERIVEFAHHDDPFGIKRLPRLIARAQLEFDRLGVPEPTHTANDVPYESGQDLAVVWAGVVVHRNLRDIFEVNRARTGEELKEADVKDPHLNEWMILSCDDGGEILSARIDRWRYPKMKAALWGTRLGEDVVVLKGYKPGWQNARSINVTQMWVISMEDE